VESFAKLGKTQRTNTLSTKVSLLFRKSRETGHYAAEGFWNEELGATREPAGIFRPRLYSLQRRNSKAPLVPPKPNEFDMAYSSSDLRIWLGTKSIPAVSGSGFSRLIVGGKT